MVSSPRHAKVWAKGVCEAGVSVTDMRFTHHTEKPAQLHTWRLKVQDGRKARAKNIYCDLHAVNGAYIGPKI